jgi:hypothetical protein
METLKEKGLTHSLKKASGSKKRKKHSEKKGSEIKQEEDLDTEDAKKTDKSAQRPSSNSALPPPTKPASASANSIRNAATASLTAKVLEEQEARNKKRKLDSRLFSSSNQTPSQKRNGDFMNRGFTIPADAKRWN